MKLEAVSDPAQEMNAEGATEHEVHFLDVLTTLVERRRFILGVTFGIALVTAIVMFLLPNQYKAETVVLPPGQNSTMSSALAGQMGGSSALASLAGASLGIKSPGDMYVALFRGRTVEDSLIQRMGLMARYHLKKMSQARSAFEKHSTVALGAKDGLIRISVSDRDPRMAADIANNYVDEFRKLSANLAITEASQRRAFFQQQLLEANGNLTAAEEKMKNTQQSTGVLQVDSQARTLIESAAILRGQVAAKEVELQAMRSYATEDNPQMYTAEQELAALKAELAKLGGTDANSRSEVIVPKGNLPAAGMEYIRNLRDVRYYETIADLIAKQFEMAKLDEARQGAAIQVADLAVPPDGHDSPKRTLIVAGTTMLSFVAACAWCFVSARLRRQSRKPEERERINALRAALRK
jgi:tyrosine-protein kinase Etk/Wzc